MKVKGIDHLFKIGKIQITGTNCWSYCESTWTPVNILRLCFGKGFFSICILNFALMFEKKPNENH